MSRLVRSAKVSDAASIAAVKLAASRVMEPAAPEAHSEDPHTQNPARYAELIQRHDGIVYVAEADGPVVGYLVLRSEGHSMINSRNPLQLWQLYVIPEFHGSGVSARLMAAAMEYAHEQLHDVVWLGVSEQNARAIAFYRKHGFKALGPYNLGAGNHEHVDLLMSCRLDAPDA